MGKADRTRRRRRDRAERDRGAEDQAMERARRWVDTLAAEGHPGGMIVRVDVPSGGWVYRVLVDGVNHGAFDAEGSIPPRAHVELGGGQ